MAPIGENRLGIIALLSINWRIGGRWSRFFVILTVTSLALLFLVTALLLLSSWYLGWPLQVALAFSLAGISAKLYDQALTAPLHGAPVLRELIRQGWTKPDDEYYEELARYREARGEGQHLKGDVAWALAYWAIFLGMQGGAVIFVLMTHPLFGRWSPYVFLALDGPVAFACFVVYGRRTTRQFREAQALGFRLLELYRRRSDVRRSKVPPATSNQGPKGER